MARYVKDIVLNKPEDFVNFIMQDYLRKNQFVMSEWKGEPAWRAGDGVVEGFKYLKWSYFNGMFHLEAWLKGTTGGEMGLDGVVGVLMKKPYRESLEQLFTVLQQELQVPPQGQHREEEQQPRPTGGAGSGAAVPADLRADNGQHKGGHGLSHIWCAQRGPVHHSDRCYHTGRSGCVTGPHGHGVQPARQGQSRAYPGYCGDLPWHYPVGTQSAPDLLKLSYYKCDVEKQGGAACIFNGSFLRGAWAAVPDKIKKSLK